VDTEVAPTAFEIEGRTVVLPVEVRVASAVLATWVVPTERVRALIGPSGLEPYGPVKGRALVSLGMIRYIDSDLGPYNEFAVAAVVKVDGVVATIIHQLPVNQAFTMAAGRQIWGFPKFLTTSTIAVDRHGGVHGTLAQDGEPILDLRIAKGLVPIGSRSTDLDTYTFADGVLRKTPFTMRAGGVRVRPAGVRLTLGSSHPMALELRSLGLGRALSCMHVPRMSATFGAPEVVSG
jgi:hypothetical protein